MKVRVGLVLASFLAVLESADAQSTAQPSEAVLEGPFVESVDVDVVNIEVFVTDRKGDRVASLGKDDFELEVDGKPVAITYFYAVEDGAPGNSGSKSSGATGTSESTLSQEPESRKRLITSPLEPQRIAEDQQLHLVVFIDNFNIRPFNRNRVIAATRSFLRTRLRQGNQVMLVTYNRSLEIRQNFTSDANLLAEALFEVEEESGGGVTFDSERRELLSRIFETETLDQIRGRASQHVLSLHNDLRFTMKALRSHVDSLAGLPGRKAVLYVSDGLPLRAGADIYEALAERFPDDSSIRSDGFRYDMTGELESLTRQANANRVTFYTLDAFGLRTFTYSDASNARLAGGANIDRAHFENVQQSLRLMAAKTGGQALLNSNDFSPLLNRMADDFGTYYSLGFSPSGDVEGRYHSVKIQLKEPRKGTALRYRDGYRDKPAATRMTEKVLAALQYGATSNPLGIEVLTNQAVRQGNDQYHVSFVVKVPIGKLSLLPQAEMHRGRVRLFVGVKDSDGGLAPIHEQVEPIDIPSSEIEKAKQQAFHLGITLVMRSGQHLVAVGARDELGALEGVAMAGARVGG